MTDSEDESEYSSNMEIEVLNNNTNMFPLHVATTLVAFLVTNHALKHVAKKAKTTSILISHKWYVE